MKKETSYRLNLAGLSLIISSWAYERAKTISGIDIIDNRAKDILCYDPCYTFVEKLQCIATKFRQEKNIGEVSTNYMRQYYDVYSLLGEEKVIQFIASEEYNKHKEKRFPLEDLKIPVRENPAFLLTDNNLKEKFQKPCERTKALYYKGQPTFEELLQRIHQYIDFKLLILLKSLNPPEKSSTFVRL